MHVLFAYNVLLNMGNLYNGLTRWKLKLIYIMFTYTVSPSHRTSFDSFLKSNQLLERLNFMDLN